MNVTQFYPFIKAILLIVIGFVLAQAAGKAIERTLGHYASRQHTLLLKKIAYFLILVLFLIAGLQQLGFKLGAVLGSAGIATAAIAIASQTTLSNIIGGLFLIMEKSFSLGDRIQVNNTVGTVESIDLLSVKVLTDHHAWIRIPNETLIRSELINLTRSDNRRIDLPLKIERGLNIAKLKSELLQLAKADARTLSVPSPTVTIQEADLRSITLQLSVWAAQKDINDLRDTLYEEILHHTPMPATPAESA